MKVRRGSLNHRRATTLFLCGDVMTGRGIDQVLPRPGDPVLFEPCVTNAREYVRLAERLRGPIPQPASFKYVWGDVLAELHQSAADVRIINLETSITASNDCWPDKGIHYRMHPRNIGCLTAARVDACALANNHVLDWGYPGLAETVGTLDRAGIAHAGAGKDAEQASAPAVIRLADNGRVLLFAMGAVTSGIPLEWRAEPDRPGVNLLEDISEATAARVAEWMRRFKQVGDLAIATIHWGGNWGYEIPRNQIRFAHRLIEEGFDLVHGHSSHHVKGMEIFNRRLILYGCGDFINDYEGIGGYEEFRNDLTLMYLVQMDSQNQLSSVRLVPMQMRQFQLHRATAADTDWLCALLNRLNATFGVRVEKAADNGLALK